MWSVNVYRVVSLSLTKVIIMSMPFALLCIDWIEIEVISIELTNGNYHRLL